MIKSTLTRFGVLVVLLFSTFSLFAQTPATTQVPYYMGFEDSDAAELQANWVLNPGAAASQCPDQWVVGSATKEDGQKSLYISTDGGVNAEYGNKRDVQYAYCDFVLASGQQYVVSFDWRCLGSQTSYLCAGYGRANGSNPLNLEAVFNPMGANMLPAAVSSAVKVNNLYGNGKWNNESFIVSGNDLLVLRVFFAWVNSNTDSTKNTLGACIDNFSITSNNVARPHDISAVTFSCDSVILSWQGTAQKYQIEYRKSGNSYWQSQIYQNPTGAVLNNSLLLDNMSEGSYSFRLRGITGQDTSAYAYHNNYQMFCPDRHCINYVDLYNKDVVTATIGDMDGYYSTTINPYKIDSVVDFGPYDKYSRHTVHWEQGFDPNTGGQLPYIPDDEMASVRLGNWNDGGEGESLTYKFHVNDNESSILLLKYAVVLEEPAGHPEDAMPRFTLDILDANMNLVDADCGREEFIAGFGDTQLWHRYTPTNTDSYYVEDVVWKEWSVMGLNLEQYQGQTIYIRLTTYDCTWQGHYGYAYFVLGCAAAHIDVLSCGSDSEMKVQAPDGFAYEWFDSNDNSVSTEQLLQLPSSDTTVYRCHLSYLQKPTCGFDIFSQSMPRFPVADFIPEWTPQDCKNLVHFKNTSHIFTNYDNVPTHHYDQPCELYYWEFLDDNTTSTATEPNHTYPQEGGTFKVYLKAMLSGGDCEHDTIIEFEVPAIGDTIRIDSASLCSGYTMEFDGKIIGKTGDYFFNGKTVAGCDSIVQLHLDVYEASPTTVLDTAVLCYGDTLCAGADCYDFKSDIFRRVLENVHGCDSVVIVPIIVKPEIVLPDISVVDEGEVEYTGQIQFSLTDGSGWTYYEVDGEKNKDLDHFTGGQYLVSFINDANGTICQIDTVLEVASGCISGAIFQRWSDVLGILNKEWQDTILVRDTENNLNNRPSYNYVGFQWYKNDQKIEGATSNYLYIPEGLKATDIYTCMLTREDGLSRPTCDFTPTEDIPAAANIYPTQVAAGGQLFVAGQVSGLKVYNALGVLIDTYGAGVEQLQAPLQQGMYIYQLQTEEGGRAIRVTVK